VLLLDNTAPVINERPILNVQEFYLVLEDPRINKYSGPDKKPGVRIHKAGGHHPHSILLLPHRDGMTCVRPYTPPGDDGGMILVGDMGHDLTLPLVTEKSPDDNCATHCPTI